MGVATYKTSSPIFLSEKSSSIYVILKDSWLYKPYYRVNFGVQTFTIRDLCAVMGQPDRVHPI